MFGLLVSGQLPQTNFQRVSENQFTIQIPDVNHVNHLVVYMTGTMPFPEGYGAAVYLNYQIGGESKWIVLGKICNTKPSAIFKIGKLRADAAHITDHPFLPFSTPEMSMNQALIGLSVEPLSTIDALVPAIEAQVSNLSSFVEYTQKMLENFFNYAASFATPAPDGQQYVPLAAVQNWYTTFQRRLEQNPNFWKTL